MSDPPSLTDAGRGAIHRVERGLEHLRRAHGRPVEFHRAVGHAMDHLEEAVNDLEGAHPRLARRLSEEVLPAGLTRRGHLSYELVEEFEEGLLATVEEVAGEARDEPTDGERYVVDRRRHGE